MIPFEIQPNTAATTQATQVPVALADGQKFSIAWLRAGENTAETETSDIVGVEAEGGLLTLAEPELATPKDETTKTPDAEVEDALAKTTGADPLNNDQLLSVADRAALPHVDEGLPMKSAEADRTTREAVTPALAGAAATVQSGDLRGRGPEGQIPQVGMETGAHANPSSTVAAAMINLSASSSNPPELPANLPPVPARNGPILESKASARATDTNVARSVPAQMTATGFAQQELADNERLLSGTPGTPAPRFAATETITPAPSGVTTSHPTPPITTTLVQTMIDPEIGRGPSDAPDLTIGTSSGATTLTTPTGQAAAAPTHSHAPFVAQQIALALVQSKGGKTEIVLNPEELGKVRIALQAAEKGMAVSIISERPETAELMRRNVEILEREFRDLGYETVSFSFDDPSDGGSDGFNASTTHDHTDEGQIHEDLVSEPRANVAVLTGLDLKL